MNAFRAFFVSISRPLGLALAALAGAACGAGAYYACASRVYERRDGDDDDDDDDDDYDDDARTRRAEASTSKKRAPIDVKHTREASRTYEALELAFATHGLDATRTTARRARARTAREAETGKRRRPWRRREE